MESEAVKVSVIVLTFNHERYIAQALDSILMQKVDFKYEILIGDDASTDGTSKIVYEFAQRYPLIIRAFIRENNLGATNNLYDLFQRTRGKYIASCEGDDFWCASNKLQRQVDFLEAHSNYSACTHDCKIVNEEGIVVENQTIPWVCAKEEYTIKDFKGVYLPGQPATLVHRNFFLNTGHDYSIIYRASPVVADRTVILILSVLGDIRRLPETMSCYRIRTDNKELSATMSMFRNNPNVNHMQYKMTCELEQYMRVEFGIRVHFTWFKWRQKLAGWIKSILRAIKQR